MTYDVAAVRAEFPQLEGGSAHFDGPGGTQTPRPVAEAIANALLAPLSNRGTVTPGESNAEKTVQDARSAIADLVAGEAAGVVFGRSATQLAYDFSRMLARAWKPGDEVVVTRLDHDSNVRPWVQAAERAGASVRWLDFDPETSELDDPRTVLSERTVLVAVTGASNLIGTRPNVRAVADAAHDVGALVYVDACQSAPHLDIRALTADDSGVDALVFTGHKTLGPSGIGVLWARQGLLEAMPPFLTGGSMIEIVRMEGSTWAPPPAKFEAGVPMAAQAVGLAAALNYLTGLGLDRVHAHDQALMRHTLKVLGERSWVRVLGPADPADRVGAVSFVVDGVHPHDVGQVLDDSGIAVRTGHHCAWPLHRRLRVPASTRASFGVYTTTEEIDQFAAALDRVPQIFGMGESA